MSTMTLHTEIEIAASPEQVWRVLTDFASYGEWNTFIRQLDGRPVVGERLKALIQPVGAKAMTFTPVVLAADAGREFRWIGRFMIPGVMDGEHLFRIETIAPGRTRFVQDETFRGLLVPIFAHQMQAGTVAGFNAMNEALKARAERIAAQES